MFIRRVNMPEMYAVSAEKQTVACDFTDIFICGYTTSKAGNISWERVSAETIGSSTQDERGRNCLKCLYPRKLTTLCPKKRKLYLAVGLYLPKLNRSSQFFHC